MELTIYTADCTGNPANCFYPNKCTAVNAGEMAELVSKDHVLAAYQNNYRSNSNFIESEVTAHDCDNDHSDDPRDWMTPDKFDELLPDVSYALIPSRHHMLPKGDKSARPRYHFIAPIEKCTDAKRYSALKAAIQKKIPVFDDNAKDAARFFFGCDVSEEDIVWHEGWINIDEEWLVDLEPEEEEFSTTKGPILEGSRNNTLSRFAGRVLKRYGECEKAHEIFLEEADKCEPPLESGELQTIWFSALKFFRNTVSNQDGYVPPDTYNDDFARGDSLKPSDYSDIGQAKVLSREYGNELRFSEATDYIRFNGDYWKEDKQMAVGAVEEFLDLQLADALDELARTKKALRDAGVSDEVLAAGGKALEKAVDDSSLQLYYDYLAAKQYYAFVMKRRDYKYITSCLNTAKPMLAVDVNDLDRDGFLLNTPGATFDLREGTFKEPDAADLITKTTLVTPSDEGKDMWLESLDKFFCGDQELIDYVQMVVGMAAVGKVYNECLIISYGEGRNGKSTFWNTILRVLGTYGGTMSADALTVGCKRNVKPEMAELKGKRLIIASELEEGMRLNTSMVKQLCSTDEITAEKKYKAPFKYTPSHTLVLYTNFLPKVGANDAGIWRRLIVIPFNAVIEGNSDIKNFADHLFENAGGYVMKWIIEGAKKVIDSNFILTYPPIVANAINRYRENNDWLGFFFEECCELGDGLTAKSGDFYAEYRAFCLRTGEYTRGTTDFYQALEGAGLNRKKTKGGSIIEGVQLKMTDFAEN